MNTKECEVIEVDTGAWRVTVDGETVELSHTQFKMLVRLVRPRGQVVTRDQLIYGVLERTADSHISHLRKRLIAKLRDGQKPIVSVYGLGYRLDAQAQFTGVPQHSCPHYF